MKNQERVWKEERKAIDERKRTQQLLKEKAEERQIEELQKMGGKREERVDWLYAAPASGSGPNEGELEQYLLGKKSVEQLFKDKDRQKVSPVVTQLTHADRSLQMEALANASANSSSAAVTPGNFQALGNNPASVRDMASKIREDPLLAIKRQEQKAYEELMKNPRKLKELREAREAAQGGKKEKKSKKHRDEDDEERAERKRRKHERKEEDRHAERSSKRSRSRSPPPRRRSRSPPTRSRHEDRPRSSYDDRRSHDERPRPSYDSRPRQDYAPTPGPSAEDREARLAVMTASAASLTSARTDRLAKQQVEDKAAAEQEERERLARRVGNGARLDPTFIKQHEKEAWKMKVGSRG